MFYRNVIAELKKWAAGEDRKPLILSGARQVGKTTAVNLFAADFQHYIYLDLEKKENADIFERKLPVHDLIQAIYLAKNISPAPSQKVLLFIDEIQNSPAAVAMMRYFYESVKSLYVIGAGSLLETMIGKEQISFPVGRVRYMFMYPMTFDEFLQAENQQEAVKLFSRVPFPGYAFPKLLKLFHTYTLIGGMPEVLKRYVKNKDIVELTPIYQGLVTAYMEDVSKYARNSTMVEVIRHAIESAPFEAGNRIKFAGFGKSNYKSREMGEALRTLQRAMLLYLLYPAVVTGPPAAADEKKSPRLQFLDTGLLNYCAGLQGHFFKFDDLHSFYQGKLAEHIVGQELTALDMNTPGKISFWVRESKQSNSEVDFILPFRHLLIPVEVKAGKTGSLRSLHQFVDRAPHAYAIRLYAGPLEINDAVTPAGKPFKLLNLPYFLASKINRYMEWFATTAE